MYTLARAQRLRGKLTLLKCLTGGKFKVVKSAWRLAPVLTLDPHQRNMTQEEKFLTRRRIAGRLLNEKDIFIQRVKETRRLKAQCRRAVIKGNNVKKGGGGEFDAEV